MYENIRDTGYILFGSINYVDARPCPLSAGLGVSRQRHSVGAFVYRSGFCGFFCCE